MRTPQCCIPPNNLNASANVRAIVNVQLLQECLSRFEPDVSKAPLSVIQICQEILSSYVTKQVNTTPRTKPMPQMNTKPQKPRMKTKHKAKTKSVVASMSSLSRIVEDPLDDSGILNDSYDDDEFADMALDLLTTITAESVQRDISQQEIIALTSCLIPLQFIIKGDSSKDRVKKAKKTASLLKARIDFTKPPTDTLPKSDEDIYTQAMEYISDPLVPVRAQGLSILRDLIFRRSLSVDLDAVLKTFIELLKDEDSYVYLNAIKSIRVLAEIDAPRFIRRSMDEYESRTDVDERVRLAEAVTGMITQMGETFTGNIADEIIGRGVRLVSKEKDWKVRTSAVGLVGVCCEIAPSSARPAIEMALHLFRVNDLSFGEEGEGAAPLRRGAVTVIAGIVQGGGIDALGDLTKEVLRSVKYLARSDGDETVKDLATGLMTMLNGVIEVNSQDTLWNVGRKIQEL